MIPTFDCAHHLRQALEGVLEQAPGPETMQIEVVDDASSDDPEAVVRAVGGGRVGFVRQPANVGQVANFATCIRRARGRYVHLLHGDDVVLPGFYEALQRGLDADPAIGAAWCRWRLIDATGAARDEAEPLQAHAGPLPDPLGVLATEQRIVTPSIAVRRSVYERLGGFDDRLACAEDWEMWVRIATTHGVWYEPQLLAAYRTHAGSTTGRNHRLGHELRYTAMAIDLFARSLPPDRAPAIARTARRTYARTALANARGFRASGDRGAMLAHLREAVRLSRSPRVLAGAGRVLAGRSSA
jgi:glycosyltransferase involved in cell wall biosynthesis